MAVDAPILLTFCADVIECETFYGGIKGWKIIKKY